MGQIENIVKGCLAGKRKAQNQLYKLYSKKMFGICYRYCKDQVTAEDMLQEGFIKIFENLKYLREISKIEGWMKRIMINALINNYHRNNYPVIPIENFDEYLAINHKNNYDEEEVDSYVQDVKVDDLIQCIREMPEGYRLVLNMFVFEGYSHKEIAEQLNISENTSKTQLFKARNYLKKKIAHFREHNNLEFKNERKFRPV